MSAPVIDLERLVRNLYLSILRREPERESLSHWVTQIRHGTDLNEVVEAFLNCDEFRSQAPAQILAYPPGHFYSPIVNPAEIASEFRRRAQLPAPVALPGISINMEAQVELWRRMLPFFREVPFPDEPSSEFRFYFQNGNYSYGDASVLYAMLRLFRPKRLVEVGAGFSTACSLDTIDRFLDGQLQVTIIEPHAELVREVLGEATINQLELIEARVQDVPLPVFTRLADGDVLFIDSTHVLKTDSDVCCELFDILPHLAPGVLVHFHDVLWPFEYPEQWVLDYNRSWNEAYALRAFLMFNSEFEILFFNDFFRRWQQDFIANTYPKFLKNTGGSLWLRKRSAAGKLEATITQIADKMPAAALAPLYANPEATATGREGRRELRGGDGPVIDATIDSANAGEAYGMIEMESQNGGPARLAQNKPNFDKVFAGAGEFGARLAAIKNAATVAFQWYPYHTLANFEHIEPLITAEYDFLFQPQKRYADFGCADGDLAYYMESQGNTLDLYDYGPTNMNNLLGARYLHRALGSSARVIEADFDSQFRIEGEYDLIFFLGLLYHLKSPFYALEVLSHASRFMLLSTRIARQFSAGGLDVSDVPAGYLLDADEANNDPTNYWIFTEAGLKRLAKRSGWDIAGFRTAGDTVHSNPQDLDRDERAFVLLKSRR